MHLYALNTLRFSETSLKKLCMKCNDKNRKYYSQCILVVRNVNGEINQMKIKVIEL